MTPEVRTCPCGCGHSWLRSAEEERWPDVLLRKDRMTRKELIERLESITLGHGTLMLFSQKLAIKEAVEALTIDNGTVLCRCGEPLRVPMPSEGNQVEWTCPKCGVKGLRAFAQPSAARIREALRAMIDKTIIYDNCGDMGVSRDDDVVVEAEAALKAYDARGDE